MDALMQRILNEPVLLLCTVLILGALVYALLKKVMKLALILALGLAALFGYFAATGQEPPSTLERIKDEAQERLEKGLERAQQKAKEVGDRAADKIQEAAEGALEKLEEDF